MSPKKQSSEFKRRKFFRARCRQCGHWSNVRRNEVIHAAPPRCPQCGGAVDFSEPALEELDHYHHSVSPEEAEEKRNNPEKTIENVLEDERAGKITWEEAVKQIAQLQRPNLG
jgi:hypothetical protein